ncbi:MAG: hypothetical protein K6G17_09465 [Oscillospiraceae bacterium]|nr:hypothetical protein [Oscillospiraceae bacterium]
MTEILCILAGLVLGAALFAAGGRRARRETPHEPPRASEERRRQLEAEQRAFRALMGYSADVAYGLERFSEEERG